MSTSKSTCAPPMGNTQPCPALFTTNVTISHYSPPWPISPKHPLPDRSKHRLLMPLLRAVARFVHKPSPDVCQHDATNNGKDGEHAALFTTSVAISHYSPPRLISPKHPHLAHSKHLISPLPCDSAPNIRRPSPKLSPHEAKNTSADGEFSTLFTTSITISRHSPARPVLRISPSLTFQIRDLAALVVPFVTLYAETMPKRVPTWCHKQWQRRQAPFPIHHKCQCLTPFTTLVDFSETHLFCTIKIPALAALAVPLATLDSQTIPTCFST